MRDSWREGVAKRGRMSTKSMPGIGKSGNCRRAARRLIFVRASSEVLEGAVVGWDWSLVALSGSAMVEGAEDDGEVCWLDVIVVREKGRERGGRVRGVVSDVVIEKKNLGWMGFDWDGAGIGW